METEETQRGVGTGAETGAGDAAGSDDSVGDDGRRHGIVNCVVSARSFVAAWMVPIVLDRPEGRTARVDLPARTALPRPRRTR